MRKTGVWNRQCNGNIINIYNETIILEMNAVWIYRYEEIEDVIYNL